jgi:uncharacterized protein (DUF952 family)
MNENIFHITTREAWDAAQAQGQYTASSLTNEGFIHCSTREQVLPVAEKFYRGQAGLILLVIDSARLTSGLKWEPPFDGAPPAGVSAAEMFPHIYGPINLDAVLQILHLELASNGRFVFSSL